MTFSVLAIDESTGAIGGAAATGNLCVGAWVLKAKAGVGAAASQGKSVSTLWREQALALLQDGNNPQQAVDRVTKADPGREHRQLCVLDAEGRAAGWTGKENEVARGHIYGDGYIISGNWLATIEVLRTMEKALLKSREDSGLRFARSLIDCIDAGISAGSDARGTFSAALTVVQQDSPPLDLRVDFDEDPLSRLRDLYQRAISPPYSVWVTSVPTVADPHRC